MSKIKTKKSELINGRLSILLFWTLFMAIWLWAERNAWGRPNLIFRSMLPWLMPILFVSFLLVGIALIVLWKKGITRAEKLFSIPFLLYLTSAPFFFTFLPWLAIFFPASQLFGIILDFLFVVLFGYFISYLFFAKISPAAGLMAGYSTLCAAVIAGHHQLYINVANAFLEITYYPNEKLIAPIVIFLLFALLFALQFVGAKKEVSFHPLSLPIPFGIATLFFITSAFFRSALPIFIRGWLVLIGIITITLWLIGKTIFDKLAKNKKKS